MKCRSLVVFYGPEDGAGVGAAVPAASRPTESHAAPAMPQGGNISRAEARGGVTVVTKDQNASGLDSRAKCNRALREPDLHVFAKLFEDCLKRSLEAQAFSGREIGGDDDVLDFLVGHFVDVDLTRQPAS